MYQFNSREHYRLIPPCVKHHTVRTAYKQVILPKSLAGLSSNNDLSDLSCYLDQLFLSPLSAGRFTFIHSSPHLQVLNAYDLYTYPNDPKVFQLAPMKQSAHLYRIIDYRLLEVEQRGNRYSHKGSNIKKQQDKDVRVPLKKHTRLR